jgi:hypothetical protein
MDSPGAGCHNGTRESSGASSAGQSTGAGPEVPAADRAEPPAEPGPRAADQPGRGRTGGAEKERTAGN